MRGKMFSLFNGIFFDTFRGGHYTGLSLKYDTIQPELIEVDLFSALLFRPKCTLS